MQKTVYKYSGRPGAKYKKDKNGNWYINDGKSTNNKYIALNDPDGKRSRVLNKSAKPLIEKASSIGVNLNSCSRTFSGSKPFLISITTLVPVWPSVKSMISEIP